VLALDLDGREAGRQRAARHDVLRADHVRVGVEVDEVAAAHVDRAEAQVRLAVVDAVEVDDALQRRPQPGDDRGVDGPDGDAGHPVRLKVRLRESLVDAGLVGSQGASPLQHQGDALEGRALTQWNAVGQQGPRSPGTFTDLLRMHVHRLAPPHPDTPRHPMDQALRSESARVCP
jgi:hypothetical protein